MRRDARVDRLRRPSSISESSCGGQDGISDRRGPATCATAAGRRAALAVAPGRVSRWSQFSHDISSQRRRITACPAKGRPFLVGVCG